VCVCAHIFRYVYSYGWSKSSLSLSLVSYRCTGNEKISLAAGNDVSNTRKRFIIPIKCKGCVYITTVHTRLQALRENRRIYVYANREISAKIILKRFAGWTHTRSRVRLVNLWLVSDLHITAGVLGELFWTVIVRCASCFITKQIPIIFAMISRLSFFRHIFCGQNVRLSNGEFEPRISSFRKFSRRRSSLELEQLFLNFVVAHLIIMFYNYCTVNHLRHTACNSVGV